MPGYDTPRANLDEERERQVSAVEKVRRELEDLERQVSAVEKVRREIEDLGPAVTDRVAVALGGATPDEAEPDPLEESAPADRERVDRALSLLELNGYNAIRHEVRAALGALASIPLDALDAALDFASRQHRRVRLGDDPRRDEALRAAEADIATLKLARGVLRDLKTLDERQAARNRITR